MISHTRFVTMTYDLEATRLAIYFLVMLAFDEMFWTSSLFLISYFVFVVSCRS
jgi:hypothetical protein